MKTERISTTIMVLIAIIFWFILFGLGLLISSQPFRNALNAEFSWKFFFLTIITYTPTNIAFLCLAAAFCGGCSKNLLLAEIENKPLNSDDKQHTKEQSIMITQNPLNSMLRGFVVYVAFLGGMYLVLNDPFEVTSQQLYARAAGVISLVSYVVGYDATNFLNLIRL